MSRRRAPTLEDVARAVRDPRLRLALAEPIADVTWRARAACRGADPEVFYPPPNDPMNAALAMCRTCPVQAPCLAMALHVEDRHGVWGATTPRERLAMQVIWRLERGHPPLEFRNSWPAAMRYKRRR